MVWSSSAWIVLFGVASAARPTVLERAADVPFSAEPKALLALAARPRDADNPPPLRVLLDADAFVFHGDQRLSQTTHAIMVIDEPYALQWFRDVSLRWAPWLEDRPEVRTRVIQPDGTELWLQDDQLVEGASTQGGDAIYTTDSVLTGPLPKLELGGVIEQVVVRHPREPLSAVSAGFDWTPAAWAEQGLVRLTVVTPAGAELRSTVPAGRPRPKHQKTDGTAAWVWEGTGAELRVDTDAAQPAWQFSVGEGWDAVAAEYLGRVAAQQDPAGTEGLVAAVDATGDRRARIAQAVDAVRDQVHYVGLELGESAIVPYAPSKVLERGFGDCKDQSNLLVTVLEEVGVPARLALIAAADPDPLHPDHPGLHAFDHAIVHLPEDDLWIDPTATWTHLGALPVSLAGHLALVIDPHTSALVKVPANDPAAHHYAERRELQLRHGAPATYVETVEATGFLGEMVASNHVGDGASADLPGLRNYAEKIYGDTSPTVALTPSGAGVSTTTLRVAGSAPVLTLWHLAHEQLNHTSVLLEWLPGWAVGDEPVDDTWSRTWTSVPYTADLVEVTHFPPGYALMSEPGETQVSAGDATLHRTVAWDAPSNTLTTTLKFNTGDGAFSAEEARQLWRWVHGELPELRPVVVDDPGREMLARRQYVQAVQHYNMLIAADPEAAWPRARRAAVLRGVGLGDAAVQDALAATVLAPDVPDVWFDLGWQKMADGAGVESFRGVDTAGAVAAFERSVELGLDPDTPLTNVALLARSQASVDLGRSRAPAAADAWERWLAAVDPDELDARMLLALFDSGRFDRIQELGEVYQGDVMTGHLVAVEALELGAPAALALARNKASAPTAELGIVASAYELLRRRQAYPAATGLVEARPELLGDPLRVRAQLPLVRAMRPWGDTLDPKTRPEHVLIAMLAHTIDHGGFDPEGPDLSAWARSSPATAAAYANATMHSLADAEVLGDSFIDNLLWGASHAVEGDDETGYRVESTFIGSDTRFRSYVVHEKRRYRLLAPEGDTAALGRQVLLLASKGELEAADRWLGWLDPTRLMDNGGMTTTFGELRKQLGGAGVEPADTRLLLGGLAAVTHPSGRAVLNERLPVLHQSGMALAPLVGMLAASRCLDVQSTECMAAVLGSPAAEVAATDPSTAVVLDGLRVFADPAGFIHDAEAKPERTGMDWNWTAMAAMLAGQPKLAVEAAQSAEAGGAPVAAPELLIWNRYLVGEDAAALVPALGNTLSATPDGRLLQALIFAAADDVESARHIFLAQWNHSKPSTIDELGVGWHAVLGRMAATLGLPDVAEACYARVPDSPATASVLQYIARERKTP